MNLKNYKIMPRKKLNHWTAREIHVLKQSVATTATVTQAFSDAHKVLKNRTIGSISAKYYDSIYKGTNKKTVSKKESELRIPIKEYRIENNTLIIKY